MKKHLERITAINPGRIQWCCHDQGITPPELAEIIGIAQSNFTRMMTGEIGITFNQLRKIADYFNRGVLFFLEQGPVDTVQVYTPQFRTLANQKSHLSTKVKAIIERVERQRDIYLSLREEVAEVEEFKFEPLDLGSFYHRVLDALLKRLDAEGKDFAATDDGELITLLREEIEKLTKKDSFISNFVSRRGYNEFIIDSAGRVLEDCVMAIAQMVRTGSFRPKFSEVSFGKAGDTHDTLGKYELVLADKRVLSLDGKIDRLDYAVVGDEKIALVFDYKRRDTSFSWSEFSHGLDMQLPIYMLAVRNAADPGTKNVAGAFYMPIEVSPRKTTLGELLERSDNFEYKAKGVFNGKFYRQLDGGTDSGWSRFYSFRVTSKDRQYGNYAISGALKPNDFEGLLRFAEQKMIQLAQEIVSGKIDVSPYRLGQVSPCSYCNYRPVCRFDWQVNDYNFLESLSKSRVLERVEVVDG